TAAKKPSFPANLTRVNSSAASSRLIPTSKCRPQNQKRVLQPQKKTCSNVGSQRALNTRRIGPLPLQLTPRFLLSKTVLGPKTISTGLSWRGSSREGCALRQPL